MNLQEVFVFLLAIGALAYLIYFFRKQTKSHNCDDCGLMEMQKKKAARETKKAH